MKRAVKRTVEAGKHKGKLVYDVAFDGLGDFNRYLIENREAVTGHRNSSTRDVAWAGGTWESAWEGIANGGNVELAAKARALSGGITMPDVNTWKQEATLEVAGGTPCIGAWLTGDPTCMVNVANVESNTAPLRIFVDTMVSCGVPAKAMMQTGLVVSAFADVLSQLRPVEVWVTFGCAANRQADACVQRVKLSAPFSLAEMALLTGHMPITRGIRFAVARFEANPDESIPWPFGDYRQSASDGGGKHAMSTIMDAQDVYIPGAALHESGALREPSAWLQRKVDEVMRGETFQLD